MAPAYTIPELLAFAGIRGYSPRLAAAINTLLNTTSEVQYQQALKTATLATSSSHEYTLKTAASDASSPEYAQVKGLHDYEANATHEGNHFEGLPIYMPLLLEQVEGATEDYLLESAILELNRQKNIVITEVQGRDASVKEFINNGDFQLSVTGLICTKNAGYPMEEVRGFEQFMGYKGSINVVHELLNKLKIDELVITDYALPAASFANAQPYTFNAISEVPIELRIEN